MNVKNIKKGFTLTELIIVIVIIGILAGVLIPTFINVVNKANKAADLSLIRNLNEALTLDRYDNGEHKNMTQALKAADDYGFAVDKIDAKVSKNKILWDSENDVFCYLVGDDTLEYYPNSVSKEIDLDDPEEDYLLWIIDNKVNSKFSTYLYGYSGTTSESDPLVANGVGLDTGKCDVAFVKYVNTPPTNTPPTAKNVVIRTNSANTTLTIDASTDVVKHYDSVGALNIIAVANASYHEYGNVAFIEIKTGRIALESGSKVDQIHLAVSEVQEGSETVTKFFNNITIAKSSDVTLPEFSRDEVEIATTGTLVVELQSDTNNDENTDSDYVWLFKQGVISQMVVTEEKADGIKKDGDKYVSYEKNNNNEEVNKETVSLGVSDKTDETKKAANEIANNYTGNNTSGTMTIGDETVDLPKLDANGDIEVVPGMTTQEIADKMGDGAKVEDVIAAGATSEDQEAAKTAIATAIQAVAEEKKDDDSLSDAEKAAMAAIAAKNTEDIITETVVSTVEENGLNSSQKETQKTNSVNSAKEKEIASLSACTIANTKYDSLEEAFASVPDYTPTTIKINKNIYVHGNAGITISSNKDITIDLNGYTVTGVFDEAKAGRLLTNYGKLTIIDTSDAGDGVLTDSGLSYDEAGNWHTDPKRNYADNVINNYGELIVESGSIIQGTNGNIVYCIDNYSGGSITIKGGYLYNYNTAAIRMFCNSTSKDNSVTIEGGVIEGYQCIWVQNPSGTTGNNNSGTKNIGNLIISGGTFNVLGSGNAIYSYEAYYSVNKKDSYGVYYDCSSININISGNPIFNGDILIYGSSSAAKEPNVNISGGTFNNDVDLNSSAVITGGTFNLGNGPFWYGWGTDTWFASCGEGWDSADAWRNQGYTVIASSQYSGYYEIYTPDANSSSLADYIATGFELSSNGDGTWSVVNQ